MMGLDAYGPVVIAGQERLGLRNESQESNSTARGGKGGNQIQEIALKWVLYLKCWIAQGSLHTSRQLEHCGGHVMHSVGPFPSLPTLLATSRSMYKYK